MSAVAVRPVGFGGMLRSEFVKLRSLRSTSWLLGFSVVAIIGITSLIAAGGPRRGPEIAVALTPADASASLVGAVGAGLTLGQLPIAVLAVLLIANEFSSGTIKTTLTAAPRRIEVLLAKTVALLVTSFASTAVSVAVAAEIAIALLRANGSPIDAGDGRMWLSLLAAVGYVVAVALVALGIGFLLRNQAGGISTALGLVLIVPLVLNVIGGLTGADWPRDVEAFLPSSAGSAFYGYPTASLGPAPSWIVLEPWQGGLVLLAWVVVLLIASGTAFRRRDA